MDVANTDLERRVLAHEQILQVVLAHMSKTEPKFLERLQHMFVEHRHAGASAQDYTDTLGYAQRIVEEVVRLNAKPNATA